MVEEIIYTSAEKGLKQGSRGFCTVVSTTGMALNLAERLESMSGYRQAFPLHDPKASLNPVCWSHMTTRLAGRSLHVISRVADAGQDYTGRSNKLAHHLVIDNVASLISGPARMLAEPGVVTDRWDGTVRHIPPRDLRSASMPATIPLVAWKALTGDEGWAGSVAEQLLQSPAPVSIIFDPGTDTLTLVREVLDLIPAAQRWNVTFSTYFTRLLAGAECQLRFVLNDTPEATSLRNDARARVVNLTSPLPAATGGTLVAMARQGQLTPLEIAPPQAPTAARPRASVETSTKDTPKDTAAEIAIPKLKPGLSPAEAVSKPQLPGELTSVSSGKKAWIIATSIAMALCVVAVGAVALWKQRDTHDPFAKFTTPSVPPATVPTDAETAAVVAEKLEEKNRLAREELELQRKSEEERKVRDALDARIASEKTVHDEKLAQQKRDRERKEDELARALKEDGPFAFIKENQHFRDSRKQWMFALPKPGEPYVGEWPQLRIDKEAVTLALYDGAASLFEACNYELTLTNHPDTPNEWTVEASQAGNIEHIGKYTLKELVRDPGIMAAPDHELQFEWLQSSTREKLAAELLRWWPLEIKVGARKAVLLQRAAQTPETIVRRPTWKGLINSKPIPVIDTDAIRVVGFTQGSKAQFTIEIAQLDRRIQKFDLAIQGDSEQEHQDSAEPKTDSEETAEASGERVTSEKFFHLSAPFEFLDSQPEVNDSLIGFGRFALSLSTTSTKGLTLNPNISLVLRLPLQKNLEKLPDSSTTSGLRTIVRNPLSLANWSPVLAEAALINIRSERTASRNDVANWYSQSIKPLPKKKAFEDEVFQDLAKSAVKAVRGVVPNCQQELLEAQNAQGKLDVDRLRIQVGGQQIMDAAQLRVATATNALQVATTQHAPRIMPFMDAMKAMSDEMKDTQTALLKDYQRISDQVAACVAATEHVQVRCTLSSKVDTGKCDNGTEVIIYFLESTSPNWPADATLPEAK